MILELLRALQSEPRYAVSGLECVIEGTRLTLRFMGANVGCWRQGEDQSWPNWSDLLVYEDGNGKLNLFESPSDAVAHFENTILPGIRAKVH